ncbi:MAG: ATP-binding protein [Defluviitaleaceae bacterium]|nr:ATP-binding protein [Defluviitaleaceae bacterium]
MSITLNYASVALGLLCIVISLIILLNLLMEGERRSSIHRYFMAFVLCNIGFMATDVVSRLVTGNTAWYALWLNRLANFFHFALGPLVLAFMTLYLLAYIELKTKVSQAIKHMAFSICAMGVLLTVVSQFTGMFYTIDEYNLYHRGEMWWLSQAFPLAGLTINMGVVVLYRKVLKNLSSLFFMIYMTLPIIAIVVQSLFFGITYINIAITLNMLIIYIRLQIEQSGTDQLEKQSLAAENAALESLSRMKTEFMANLSHEIKTPLTVVLGDIQRIGREVSRQGFGNERISESISRAKDEIMRMARLTESAIKMAALQESREKTAILAPASLFITGAEGYRSIIEKQSNVLIINAEENLPHIYGNADQLIGVLSNLLTNANKHTRNGKLAVNIESDERFVSVTVKDSGTGIPPDILPFVFERGVSGSCSTGMGLAICKNTIESHGGEIYIKSEAGKGTAVIFTIPAINKERLVEADV